MKKIPDKETIEALKIEYPVGCRIVLDRMEDPYSCMKEGTQATVCGIDDVGSVMSEWDDGGSLNIVYGVDLCHKISTEEEAQTTLEWYGRHQPHTDARCPRCGMKMEGSVLRYALSRWADIMVCDSCGMAEALEQAGLTEKKPLMEWTAVKNPQNGDGRWEG